MTPNASGDANILFASRPAGTYVVTATVQCPTAFVLPGCSAITPLTFTVTVENTAISAVTPVPPTPTNVFPGDNLPIVVYFGSLVLLYELVRRLDCQVVRRVPS